MVLVLKKKIIIGFLRDFFELIKVEIEVQEDQDWGFQLSSI